MTAMQNDEGGLQLLTLGGDGDLGYHDTGQGEAIVQVHAARAESAFFFADELPAVQEWVFGSSQAARITQPALVVLGADSAQLTPLVVETVQRLSAMLPHARSQVLPGCSHLMPLQQPAELARLITEFIDTIPTASAAEAVSP
jgi:pimeloyl-ACP methyl ester carboxylesterase